MKNTNFINECKNRVNGNRLGKIALEGRKKLNNQTLLIENSVPNSKIDLELCGKSTQETSTRSINYCPDIDKWSLNNEAYIENGYIVLPKNTSNAASPLIPIDKQQYFWFAYAKVYTEIENNKVLCNTQYYDGNKKLLSGNGNATYIENVSVDNNYYWTFGGGSETQYGQALYNAKYIRIIFAYNSNYSNGAYKIKCPMITSENQPTFVPYVPNMPSPDYPSEIENVKGRNLINIDDKNYVDTLISVDKDGWITATYDNTNGTATKFMNYFTNNLNLKTSSKYNAIVEVKSVSGSGVLTLLSSLQNYGQSIAGQSFSFNVLSNNSIYNSVFTTKSSFAGITQGIRSYVMFRAGESGSITFRLSVLEDISDFRYVPYGNIQIVETGKNLLDNKNPNYIVGATWQPTETGGKISASTTWSWVGWNLKLNMDKQYTFSYGARNSKNIYLYIRTYTDATYTTIKTKIVTDGVKLQNTFKPDSEYVRIAFANNAVIEDIEIPNIQLEKGSPATDYEPYTEEVVNIDLKGNELCSLPNGTKDELIVKDGRAKIVKKIGEVVLDGSETITGIWRDTETTHIFKISDIKLDNLYTTLTNTDEVFAMCDYFKVHPYDAGANSIWAIRRDNNDFKNALAIINTKGNANYKSIIVKHSGCVTSAEFKDWLSTHNTTVQYELAEPYEIDLGEVATLKTFNGTTYITNSEDAKMSVEASVWQNEISNSDYLQSFEINNGCYVDGNIIGSVYAKCLKANFIDDQNNLTDKSIQAQIGVKYADLSNEYINMGKYTVERPNNEITANMSQITAYDDLYTNLDKKYVCNIDYSDGDKTLSDLYADVCKQLGLTPVTTTFTNSTIPIVDNPFTNGEKNRTVLQTVAKISCSFIDIDDDTNKIDLCWLSDSDEPDYVFNLSDYSNVEGGKIVCGPINCLIIKNSQIDDENVTIKDDESIATNGEHSITISEDYILYNAELRQQAINAIWNKVKGMKYVDCKLTTYYGKPFLKLGKYIRVYLSETEYFDTYVLKHNFTFDGTFTSVIESPAPTEQEIKTKQDISLGEALRNTQIEVNKQKGEIRSITTKQENIQSDITNNYYNKTSMDELLQTAESGITNTFSEAGGNNIFRNTGLWFKADTANIQNLYNESFIYCTYNSDAVNKSLTNVYPSSTSVTSYIRSEELMEINSAYEYSLDVPELTYKHGDTTLSYKTSLLELTSNREFQLENGEILKHELSAGSSTIKFKNNTAYVMLLLENQNFSRNILVGDDLNGKTIYSSLPDNFYETLNEQTVTTSMFVKTSTSNAIGVHTQLSKGLFNVGCNIISNFEQSIMPTINFYIKNDMTTVNEKSLTMSDTFGTVTEIDKNNLAYPYLKIGIDTNLEIVDAKTTLKELSIQIKTSDNLYEFWEGEIVRNSNDEAANNNSMLLLNGEVYQEQEVPNGNYAVSFMYQKLNELANASVLINDKEYQLDSTELKQFYTGEQDNETKEYITQPVEVTTNHIRITFKCDVDNAVEIYDLMCNKGTVKLAYSQNENETTTETVNISKGITITSTNMETIFKANANGIKILTLQNATIAYFTDKGLSTKELIVEDEAQICRTLIQDVGDQTWFTRM